jgi:hypothetical protein
MNGLDLTGQIYGRLTVIKQAPNNARGRKAWECLCSCKKIKIVAQEDLRDGSTKSCGCLNNDQRSARAKAMYAKITKYATASIAAARQVWRKNYKRELPFDDFFELSQQNCFYCNAPPTNCQDSCRQDGNKILKDSENEGDFIYNGLDRVDSSLSHMKENCVPACKDCNLKKSDDDVFKFALWIVRIYNYWAKDFDMKSNYFIDNPNTDDYLW